MKDIATKFTDDNMIRSISIEYDPYGYASASVLLSQGKTKVFCAASLQKSVPLFLRGQGTGWLTAEYSMLPTATHQRIQRDSSSAQRNARSSEISRIIGRCLRTTIDLEALGEYTINVDCDVLQADGGTRTACITAASLALKTACSRWKQEKIIKNDIFKESIYAISAGIVNDRLCIDLNYQQDSNADSDFNFIFTESEKILEIQGTAEKKAISWGDLEALKNMALVGIQKIKKRCSQTSPSHKKVHHPKSNYFRKKINNKTNKNLFSLGKRVNLQSQ